MIKKNQIKNDSLLVLNEHSSFFYKEENGVITIKDNSNYLLEKNHKHSILLIDEKKFNTFVFEEDNSILDNSDIMDIIQTKILKDSNIEDISTVDIHYIRTESPFDTRKSQIVVYAVPKNFIKEEYGQIAESLKYIDYITSPSFLPTVLYENEILENEKTDVFIYFGRDNSFITIFINGIYVYSKDFPVTLEDIYNKLLKKINHKISFEEFSVLLTERGFNIEAYEGDDMNILDILINDIFHDAFNTINKIIMSGRRMLKIENIDRFYLGTEVGSIPEMTDYSKEKLFGVDTFDMSFKEEVGLNENLKQVNPLVEYSILLFRKPTDKIINLSEFKHPVPLKERPSFIPLSIIGAGLSLFVLFLIGENFYISSLKKQVNELNSKNSEFKITLAETEQYRKKILGEKKNLIDKETLTQNLLGQKIEKLKKLKIQINTNEALTGYILNIFKKLSQNKLVLKRYSMNGNNITLEVETDKHINIGNFINKTMDTNLYNVSVSKVQYLPKLGIYKTSIKLKRIN